VRDRLLAVNPASEVENRRTTKRTDRAQHAQRHCWTATEARAVLAAANGTRTQLAAFAHLALDSGARKSELCGLTWDRVDLDAGTVRIDRQLDAAGAEPEPVFGPTKTDRGRTIALHSETISRLKTHKRSQAELRMRNRTTYQDFGLVFAREREDLTTPSAALGQPFDALHLRLHRIVKAAGVRRIKFHGLRHTCATLLLQAGVHVVAQRLGHANPMMTLTVYAHVLPSIETEAAAMLGALLHG